MKCQNCGTESPSDAKYCQACGEEIHSHTGAEEPAQPGNAPAQGAADTSGEHVGTPSQQPSAPQNPPQSGQGGQQRRQQSSTNTANGLASQIRLLPGAIGGAVAFVLALVVNSALFFFELTSIPEATGIGGNLLSQLAETFGGGEVVSLFGWLFYNAHTVEISAGSGAQGQTVNVLDRFYAQLPDAALTVPKILYTVVPILVLLLFGYLLGRGARGASAGAVRGASVAIGYLILAVAGGMTVFSVSTGIGSAGPALGLTVLMMGLAFPVVAGGVGGALAG